MTIRTLIEKEHECLVRLDGVWVRGRYRIDLNTPKLLMGIILIEDIPLGHRGAILNNFEGDRFSPPLYLAFTAYTDSPDVIRILDSEIEYA